MRKTAIAMALFALLAPAAAWPQTDVTAAADNAGDTVGNGVYDQLNLFGEAFERIRHDSVDPVTDKRLVQTAIAGMLAGLDPHSVYLTEKQYQALQANTPETSGTIGLVVTIDNSEVKVVSPRDGSPAAKADIKPDDVIYTINKEPTYDQTLPEVERMLHGPVGSEVKLMLRRGTGELVGVTLKRVAGQFPTVSHALEDGNIGYIRLSGFDDGTPDLLAAAVKDLRQEAGGKLIGFILDLRNNPGGKFAAAVKCADDFIEKGDIALLKSRKPEEVKHIASTPGDLANGQPIVALVNGGTAGVAELVAGALQDNKRAVLLGSRTFGESAIETLIPLNGAGAIQLTTARFLTPDGHEIEGKGLTPNLTVSPLKLEKVVESDGLREVDLPGAMKNPDQPEKSAATAGGAAPVKTTTTATPPKGEQPTVATKDIGTTSDEQLAEAEDVLRGLALIAGQTASR
ncbi:MAG TPA: S41 family peptidase [Stellaceae bacterium]|nr:S41 family peptidase [Stellaceae bacterium]